MGTHPDEKEKRQTNTCRLSIIHVGPLGRPRDFDSYREACCSASLPMTGSMNFFSL